MKTGKFLLNDSQLDRLSEFTANLGLVLLASVLAPLFSGVDKRDPFVIVSGLAGTIFCLIASIYLLRKERR